MLFLFFFFLCSAHIIAVILLLMAPYWDHDQKVKEGALLDTRDPINLQPETPWRPMFEGPNGNTLDEDPTEYDSDGEPYPQKAGRRSRRNRGARDRSHSFSHQTPSGDRSQRRSRSSSIASGELHLSDSEEDDDTGPKTQIPPKPRGYQRLAFTHKPSKEYCPFSPLRLINDSGSHCWLSAAIVLVIYGKRLVATSLGQVFDADHLPAFDNGFSTSLRHSALYSPEMK